MSARLPKQEDVNWEDPTDHFLWALSVVQVGTTVSQPIQPNLARNMSKHLVECGFAHRDYLASLADENGYIHVDQLPKQKKKFQPPVRGQQHYLNGLGTWVGIDKEEPESIMLPDVGAMTNEEQQWIANELRAYGAIKDPPPDRGKPATVTSLRDIKTRKVRSAGEMGFDQWA